MNQKHIRVIGIILAAVVLAVLLIIFVNIKDNDEESDSNPTPTTPTVSSSPEPSNSSSDSQVQEDKAKLVDQTWIWVRTTKASGEVVSPNQAGAFTLDFDENERVSVGTDCNSMSGGYQIPAPSRIEFSQLASTMMFCEDSQETEFSQMVQDSTGYIFDDDGNLVLLLKFDSGSVLFE